MKPDFRIEGKAVDGDRLQAELARRVEERRKAGVCSDEVLSKLAEGLPGQDEGDSLPPIARLDYAATRARHSWAVTAAYPVSTEKRVLGPLVILAKRLARFWARVAVGPIQREQSTFNRHVSSALAALRDEAVFERASRRAEEEDLCMIAESLIGEDETGFLASVCSEALGSKRNLTVIGPCAGGLASDLSGRGYLVTTVSVGTPWDRRAGPAVEGAPLSFIEEAPEGSLEALLIPEIAFWLRPERLVRLIRRAYLALSPGGVILIAVHGFASYAPAPGWCDPRVVTGVLAAAGFRHATVNRPEDDRPGAAAPYVVSAFRP